MLKIKKENLVEIKKDLFRYVKFVFGGGISIVINLIITYILTEMFSIWQMISFSIALSLEVIFLFIYHSFITFKKNGNLKLFIIVILSISALNWIFVYILTELFNVQYLIAIVFVAGTISIFNYFINKKLVFKDKI